MKKWNIVKNINPPINVPFWGYSGYSKTVNEYEWDGKQFEEEDIPFVMCINGDGDDSCILYWMEMEKEPDVPNVNLEN